MKRHQNLNFQFRTQQKFKGKTHFFNPFDQDANKRQFFYSDSKLNAKSNQNILQSSQSRKSTKIQKAKQLLALRLKQVTNLQPQSQISIKIDKVKGQNQNQAKINWDIHLNPISKLTQKPFVRSKTCDEIRKQYSLKKQRKRNNSASKFSTPNANECGVATQSTGLRAGSMPNNNGKHYVAQFRENTQNKLNQEPQVRQFSLNPFNLGNTFETFNAQKIEKISKETQKNGIKNRSGYKKGPKIQKQSQIANLSSKQQIGDLVYPFKINSVHNQSAKRNNQQNIQGEKIKIKQIKLELKNKNNEIPNLNNEINQKFTPRLEIYQDTVQNNLWNSPSKRQFAQTQKNRTMKKSQVNRLIETQNQKSKDKRKANEISSTVMRKLIQSNNFSSMNKRLIINQQEQENDRIKEDSKQFEQDQQDYGEQQNQEQYHQYCNQNYRQNEQLQDQPIYNNSQFNSQVSNSLSFPTNQIITNLNLTNTILQQKLKIKEKQIEFLEKNYVQIKNQLSQFKKTQPQSKAIQSEKYIKTQQKKQANFTTNYENRGSQSYGQNRNQNKPTINLTNQMYLNDSNSKSNHFQRNQHSWNLTKNQMFPSLKFHDSIQDEFNRQRQVVSCQYQEKSSEQRNQSLPFSKIRSAVSRHIQSQVSVTPPKRKQLFASDLSQKVSEQYESQQTYLKSIAQKRQLDDQSRVIKKHTFKKSNFSRNMPPQVPKSNQSQINLMQRLTEQNEEKEQCQSKNRLRSSDSINSKQKINYEENQVQQNNLQTANEKNAFSLNFSQDNINLISPIKQGPAQRRQMFSYYHQNYGDSASKSARSSQESSQKFNYYLTPQKDQGSASDCFNFGNKVQNRQQEEGLFQKALSSIKKIPPLLIYSQNQNLPQALEQEKLSRQNKNQFFRNPKSQWSDKKKTNVIDHVVQENFQQLQ